MAIYIVVPSWCCPHRPVHCLEKISEIERFGVSKSDYVANAGEELRSKSPRVVKKVTPVLNPGGAIYDLAMFGTETRLAELVGS